MATSTLGHSAPLLTLGVIAAHEEDGHHPTWGRGEHSSSYLLQDSLQRFKNRCKEPKSLICGSSETTSLRWFLCISSYTKLNLVAP